MEPFTRNGSIIGKKLTLNDTRTYSSSLIGQAEYTTPGTYSWTAPEGVTSVCVVCVGGGGGPASSSSGASGAGGGGLGWKNNIPVIPGNSYTVQVGAGGTIVLQGTAPSGGDSFFIDITTVAGLGGSGAIAAGNGNPAGGGFVGDGGGNGGNGGNRNSSTGAAAGGGGAGGYSGNGGNGGNASNGSGTSGSGGGGGGGGAGASADTSGSGGGVGIYGEGESGLGGAGSSSDGAGGFGGSGGDNASQASTTALGNVYSGTNRSTPGRYGGGGGSSDGQSAELNPGGNGAVRIIWGPGRAFPNTATRDNEGRTFRNSGVWDLSAAYLNTKIQYIEDNFITFVGSPTSQVNSSTIDLPLGLRENDLVFVLTMRDISIGSSLPTGYTSGQDGSATFINYRWAYKRMAAIPDTIASGLTSAIDTQHLAFAVRGVQNSIFDSSTPTATTGTSGLPNPPAITTIRENTRVLKFGFLRDITALDLTPPTEFLPYIYYSSSAALGTIMVSYKDFLTPTSITNGAYTGTGSNYWAGITIALRAKATG